MIEDAFEMPKNKYLMERKYIVLEGFEESSVPLLHATDFYGFVVFVCFGFFFFLIEMSVSDI